jgi:hypothetical protein
MEDVTLALSQPLLAHGENVTTLTFKPVTAGEIRRCGWPFIMSKEGEEQRIDADAISKYIANCARIPPSSVDKMVPSDWKAAMVVILDFFGASTPAAPST